MNATLKLERAPTLGIVKESVAEVSDGLARVECAPRQNRDGVTVSKCPCCDKLDAIEVRAAPHKRGATIACSQGCDGSAIADRLGLTPALGSDQTSTTKTRRAQPAPDEPWRAPLPLAREYGPPFPADALPSAVGPLVHAVAEANQVPLDMAAGAALGALSVAAARKAIVQLTPNHAEPTNLYVCVVAASGQRKSKVFADFSAPLIVYEDTEAKRRAPDVIKARSERDRLAAEKEKARKESDWARSLQIDADLLQLPQVADFRLMTSDVTAQKLASMLADQGGRMAVISAEPEAFMTMAGRWNRDSAAELDVFLKGHAGDSIRVDRQGRSADRIEAPALTLCLGAQPSALRRFSQVEGVLDRGIFARFLFVLARDVRGTRDVRKASAVSEGTRAEYNACLNALLALPAPREEAQLPRIALSLDAREVWLTFAQEIEDRLAPTGDLRHLSGWGEKSAGMVARVAGLFHMAESGTDGTLQAETLRKAIDVGRWAIAHAKVAFGVADMDPKTLAARDILEHLRLEAKRSGSLASTQREVHQALRGRSRWKSATDLGPGFDLLVEHGWIRPKEGASHGRGGRPTALFVVHPRVADSSSKHSKPTTHGGSEDFEHEDVAPASTPPAAEPTPEVNQWE